MSKAERGTGGTIVRQAWGGSCTAAGPPAEVRVCGGAAKRAGAVVAIAREGLAARSGRDAGGGLAPEAAWAGPAGPMMQIKAHIRAIGVEVVLICELNDAASAQGDVRLDLLASSVHVLRHAGHLEHRLLVAAGRHDVRVRLLLDALDRGALGPHHEPHHAIGHPHLDGGLPRQVRRPGHCAVERRVLIPRGADHGEVLGGRDDLPPSHGHILLPARHNKDRLLPTNRGLDISVGLRPQRFDFTTWEPECRGGSGRERQTRPLPQGNRGDLGLPAYGAAGRQNARWAERGRLPHRPRAAPRAGKRVPPARRSRNSPLAAQPSPSDCSRPEPNPRIPEKVSWGDAAGIQRDAPPSALKTRQGDSGKATEGRDPPARGGTGGNGGQSRDPLFLLWAPFRFAEIQNPPPIRCLLLLLPPPKGPIKGPLPQASYI